MRDQCATCKRYAHAKQRLEEKGVYSTLPLHCSTGWWTPGEIIYCQKQCIFLCRWYDEHFPDVSWPREDEDTDHSEDRSEKLPSCPYEQTAWVWALFAPRIDATGKDGIILIEQCKSGIKKFKEFRVESQHALEYIQGKYAKQQSYSQWLADNARRNRGRKTIKNMVWESSKFLCSKLN